MRICWTLTLLLFTHLAFAGDTPRVIGHVIQPGGDWYDEQYKFTVNKGYKLFSDSKLVHTSKSSNDFVRVRFYANGKEERFECEKIDCSEAIDLLSRMPKRVETGNPAVVFLEAAYGVLKDNLSQQNGQARSFSDYARAFSRGEAASLADNLAFLGAEGMELSRVFAALPVGDYLVELCPVGLDAKAVCAEPPVTFGLSWGPGRNTHWKPQEFAPGLYQLNLCNKIGDRTLRSPDSAWVLLLESTRKKDAEREFDGAMALTKDWEPGESAMLMRAYLQHMNMEFNHPL
jgi:hypothetical protein